MGEGLGLVTAPDGIPSRDRYLDAVFGETGYLSRVFADYRPRPGQVALAEAVERSIVGRTHLLAEGPTGTGKSLAYAAPASYHAWESGRTVVIVTANIALQEQIVQKDLPLLRRIVPWPFTFALLKGRNNFLCVDKLYGYKGDKSMQRNLYGGGAHEAEERRQLPIVEQWADDCVRAGIENEDGDVSDLPFEPLHTVWRRFSVSSDECKKSRCRYRTECFPNHAAQRARTAKVIVTNYHMLFAHLSVYMATGLDVVIAPFEHVILDEAHKAADIARDFFGFRVTLESVRRVGRKVRDDEPALYEVVDRVAFRLFDQLAGLRANRERYKARLNGAFLAHEMTTWEELRASLQRIQIVFQGRVSNLNVEIQRLKSSGQGMGDAADEVGDRLSEAELDLRRASEVLANLDRAMHPTSDPRSVFYLEEDDKQRIAVCSKLIFASDALTPGLFEKRVSYKKDDQEEKDLSEDRGRLEAKLMKLEALHDGTTFEGERENARAAVERVVARLAEIATQADRVQEDPRVTVIATSATLSTGAQSFKYIADELGVPDGYTTLVADSPFDWPRQCLFIVPETMPSPQEPEFRDAVARHVEKTILLAGGRTLGLFTSRRVLEHTYDAVVGTCRTHKIRLFKQGDAPRTKLIAMFKADVTSVLLGTESFWAGVDVPGESLSVVVIDRLPFPTPDDPVLDALSAEDDQWFFKYSVPRSMIAFKQGFGRLIRSMECRGAVVCLDSRILTKRYGKDFLRALPHPKIPKSTRLDDLAEWLNPPPAPAWDAL